MESAVKKILLTDAAVTRLPFAAAGQYTVRDTEQAGFLVKVGKRSRTYMAQGEFWREGHREFAATAKLGDADTLSARDARKKAKYAVGKIARGERPGEEGVPRRGEVTLREAWERYKEAHLVRKNRGPRTVKGYQDHMDQHFADWLDRPLARLGRNPQIVTERHDKVTKQIGPYAANGCMRTLRAVYNHAARSHLDLPRNPVLAVDWNVEERRDTGMGEAELPAWFGQLSGIANPVRREFHLLLLLSGSRPDALKKARLEHLDLRRRVLHLPKPKGGAKKAFDIPLSRLMVRSLLRLIRAGRMLHPEQAEFWLFPAGSTAGYLTEHKEERHILSKWGNELRQSYRTLAQPAGVSELDVHLLMNHSLSGVNANYITRHRLLENHLRDAQEKISHVVVEAAVSARQPSCKPIADWLGSCRVQPDLLQADNSLDIAAERQRANSGNRRPAGLRISTAFGCIDDWSCAPRRSAH